MARKNLRASLLAVCAACLAPLSQSAGAASSADQPPFTAPQQAGEPGHPHSEAHWEGLPPRPVSTPEAGDRDSDQNYRALLKSEASKNGLPPEVADAVAAIESGYDAHAIGAAGEVGLMQVRPATAAMLGFKGDLAALAKPEVNIPYGVTYLSQAWRLAGGDLCRALMKYRAGHGEETMSPLSEAYCLKARARLAAQGSPYAADGFMPVASAAPSPRLLVPRRGPPKNRTLAVSRAFWAAEEARVRAITEQLHAKWRQMASR